MKDFISERVCLYTSMYKGRSVAREIIDYAISRRAAGVELMSFCDELSIPDRKAARELYGVIKQNGLVSPCFSMGRNFAEGDIKESIDKAKAYIDICSENEVPYFHHTLVSYLNHSKVSGRFESLFELGVSVARELNEYGKKMGVKTLVENQGMVFNGIDNYEAFLQRCDGQVGPLYDIGNIMFVDESPVSLAKKVALKTCHIHLKDYILTKSSEGAEYCTKQGQGLTNCPIGDGCCQVNDVIDIFEKSGYKGYYSLELISNVTVDDKGADIQLNTVRKIAENL